VVALEGGLYFYRIVQVVDVALPPYELNPPQINGVCKMLKVDVLVGVEFSRGAGVHGDVSLPVFLSNRVGSISSWEDVCAGPGHKLHSGHKDRDISPVSRNPCMRL